MNAAAENTPANSLEAVRATEHALSDRDARRQGAETALAAARAVADRALEEARERGAARAAAIGRRRRAEAEQEAETIRAAARQRGREIAVRLDAQRSELVDELVAVVLGHGEERGS